MIDLAALKALYEAATEHDDSPWIVKPTVIHHDDFDVSANEVETPSGALVGIVYVDAHAAFAVAARTHWLELLAMAGESVALHDKLNIAKQGLVALSRVNDACDRLTATATLAAIEFPKDCGGKYHLMVKTLSDMIDEKEAQKAATAERLEMAKTALEYYDNCDGIAGVLASRALTAIAAHEAERGERMSDRFSKNVEDAIHQYGAELKLREEVAALRAELAAEREKTRIAVETLRYDEQIYGSTRAHNAIAAIAAVKVKT